MGIENEETLELAELKTVLALSPLHKEERIERITGEENARCS